MAKSVFLLNSGRRKMRAQLRRLEPLRGTALKLEGPFRDDHGELSRLLDQIRAGRPRCRSAQKPLIATMLALGPQNIPFTTRSWLETPFILGENPEETDFSSAGDIAACRPVSAYGSMFRSLDLESITMIAVAVLRRFGVPALFAYQHIDPEQPELKLVALSCLLRGEEAVLNPIPSIVVMDGLDILAFSPPEISDFPGGRLIKGLEVLGDDALTAVMKIKTAYLNMLQLMDDMGSRSQYFEGEGRMRAISIGHLFYEGISAWRLKEAEQSLKDTEGIMSQGDSGLKSVRRLAEDYQLRTAVCPVHHISLAADIILDREDKELLNHLVGAATRKEFPLLSSIIGQIPDRGSFRKLYAYMEFGKQIKEHLHPAKLCKDIKPSAGN